MANEAQSEPTAAEPEAREASIDAQAFLASAAETVADEARRHPYRTLGIAFGAGYVLGGGVPRFIVRMATTAALRAIGRAILTSDAVAALARDALDAARTPRRRNGVSRKRNGDPRARG